MLKQLFFYAALFWTGFILFLCLIKSSDFPLVHIKNIDKVVHAFLHFVFTTLWFLFFKKKFFNLSTMRLLVCSLFGSLIFGISIELMQHYFTTTRSADVVDVLANFTGALLAVITILAVNKYNGIVNKI